MYISKRTCTYKIESRDLHSKHKELPNLGVLCKYRKTMGFLPPEILVKEELTSWAEWSLGSDFTPFVENLST